MRRRHVRISEQERPASSALARSKAGAERPEEARSARHELLRLQRSGGNQAVTSLLARDGGDDDDRPVDTTLLLPEPLGVLPVESWSFGQDPKQEIDVVVPQTALSAKIFEYAAKGRPLGDVKISSPRLTVTIAGTLIRSVHGTSRLSFQLVGTVDVSRN